MNTSSKKENKQPLLVGLTGGIGSGKSTVAKLFRTLGIPVFNSDDEAKVIINNNKEVRQQVIVEFGEVYDHGKLDTQKMAGLVFGNEEALSKLNNIIHPKVKEYFDNWVTDNNHHQIVIKEAAILIESGAYHQMDKIILVKAHENIRIQRVVARDNVVEEKVRERMLVQISDKEKSRYAHFTINNDGHEMLIPQVLEILEELKKLK